MATKSEQAREAVLEHFRAKGYRIEDPTPAHPKATYLESPRPGPRSRRLRMTRTHIRAQYHMAGQGWVNSPIPGMPITAMATLILAKREPAR